MYDIKQSTTAYELLFLLVLTSDHISPATAKAPTVTIRKAGGAFAAPAGAVTEIANGWYKVAGNAADSNTLGPLVLHATEAASDPTDVVYNVVAYDPQDAVALGLSRIDATITSRMATFTLPTNFSALSISAAGLVDILQTAADKVWGSATRTLTAFSTALALSVWDVLTANILTASSIGLKLKNWTLGTDNRALVSADAHSSGETVAAVAGAVGSVTGAVGSVTGAVGSVTGAVGSVTADVGITQAAADKVFGAAGAALPELAQGIPAATPSPRQGLMLLYMALRNLDQVTASEKRITNDAGTVIAKKALTDDGTTYAEAKMGSGP